MTSTQGYVLITGATGGIGQALVRTFTDAGYAVIATDLAATPPPGLPAAHYVAVDRDAGGGGAAGSGVGGWRART